MKNSQNLLIWGSVILVGVGLILYSYLGKSSDNGTALPTTSDNSQESPTVSPTPTPTPRPSAPTVSTQEPFLGLNGVKSPATCQVEGGVEFTAADSFISKGSKISWQNIDSRGRLIKWQVSPKDDLAVGPNIFESLPLPDGQYQNLTVRLPEKPIAKTYILTASVTYGQFVKGDLKIKETNCTGQVKVDLNF